MNIKTFRNNFCKLAEGHEIITVTKRNEIVGTYTPRSQDDSFCQSAQLSGKICKNKAEKVVLVEYQDIKLEISVCSDCLETLEQDERLSIKKKDKR